MTKQVYMMVEEDENYYGLDANIRIFHKEANGQNALNEAFKRLLFNIKEIGESKRFEMYSEFIQKHKMSQYYIEQQGGQWAGWVEPKPVKVKEGKENAVNNETAGLFSIHKCAYEYLIKTNNGLLMNDKKMFLNGLKDFNNAVKLLQNNAESLLKKVTNGTGTKTVYIAGTEEDHEITMELFDTKEEAAKWIYKEMEQKMKINDIDEDEKTKVRKKFTESNETETCITSTYGNIYLKILERKIEDTEE